MQTRKHAHSHLYSPSVAWSGVDALRKDINGKQQLCPAASQHVGFMSPLNSLDPLVKACGGLTPAPDGRSWWTRPPQTPPQRLTPAACCPGRLLAPKRSSNKCSWKWEEKCACVQTFAFALYYYKIIVQYLHYWRAFVLF